MSTQHVGATHNKAYLDQLNLLLIDYYQQQSLTKTLNHHQAHHIQGFMEAGLVAQWVSQIQLAEEVDRAHRAVFGVPYQSRNHPSAEHDQLLDIPTWLRKKQRKPQA